MLRNGWNLFQFKLFAARLKQLENDVSALAVADPKGYKQHPKTKLLASVFKSILETVPANPDDPIFRLGHSLGKGNAHWRRVKKGLPQRYRLFFRFSSSPIRVIVYVWFNDEETLRKEGSRTDVYLVFRSKLERGEIPTNIEDLLHESDSE